MAYSKRPGWLEWKNELQNFRPELSATPNDTSSLKKAVQETLGLFLGRNLRNARNDVTVNAYQEWEHQARELFTSQHFDLIRNNTKLFTDRANKDRDIRNITFRYLLSEFGYPALHMSQNLDSLVQNYTQDAVNHYLSQKRALRTLNAIQSERERIREQIEREKEYVLDDDMYKEFVDLINDFTKDIEESIEKKQHRRQSMLNDIVEHPIRTVQRHHAAKLAIQNLTERLHELEEIGDDVQEVSAAQSHSNELLRKVDELEHQRVSKRRNEFREWLERRAHSQEEIAKRMRFVSANPKRISNYTLMTILLTMNVSQRLLIVSNLTPVSMSPVSAMMNVRY